MQVIEVPVFNEDGTVQIVQKISPDEAQMLLQFALNFNLAMGFSATAQRAKQPEMND